MSITNRIIKTEPVAWKTLEWLQGGLKEISPESFNRLKFSLKRHSFIQPFNVWQDDQGKLWILDGHHRKKAMLELIAEGMEIPDLLPANFIVCHSRQEASELVLVYSSIYAAVTPELEFLQTEVLDFSLLKQEIDLPEISNLKFETDFLTVPDYQPGTGAPNSRLDQRSPVTCPNCQHEFIPNK